MTPPRRQPGSASSFYCVCAHVPRNTRIRWSQGRLNRQIKLSRPHVETLPSSYYLHTECARKELIKISTFLGNMYICFRKSVHGTKCQLVAFEPNYNPVARPTRVCHLTQPTGTGLDIYREIYIRTGEPIRRTALSGCTCLQFGGTTANWSTAAGMPSGLPLGLHAFMTTLHGSKPEEGSAYASTRID